MREYEKIKTAIIRGGTSKGLFLMDNDLPRDQKSRDQVILELYGSPDARQIDGLGGADPLTSKVAIIKPSLSNEDTDIDYTFGQVSINQASVNYNGNCGNLSTGVGPFAIDEGLVPAVEPITTVRIFNTNTQKIIEAEVPVKNGKALTKGDFVIPGVPGSGAKIELNFLNPAGSITGKLLPTGNPRDIIKLKDGTELDVSLVDAANPSVFVKAKDVGLTGKELSHEISSRELDKLEEIRSIAAEMYGFVTDRSQASIKSPTIPKMVFLSEADNYETSEGDTVPEEMISFIARQISMQKMHKAFAVTGGICTSAAAFIEGTVVNDLVKIKDHRKVYIGHPSGVMEFNIELEQNQDGDIHLVKAGSGRTSRRLMEGYAFVSRKSFWNKNN